MNDQVPLDSVIVKDLRLTKHPFHRLQVQSRSTRRVAVNVVTKYSRVWPSSLTRPARFGPVSVCRWYVRHKPMLVSSSKRATVQMFPDHSLASHWRLGYFINDLFWPRPSCVITSRMLTSFQLHAISCIYTTSQNIWFGFVWVEFNAPPDTI